MNELKSMLDLLSCADGFVCPGRASEEEISEFEEQHGVVLPAQYRQWLLLADGGELYPPAGVQLYGVAHKPFIDPDDNDRPSGDYVVIGALSTGDPIVFKKGGEGVAIYNHEAGRIEGDESYDDFLAFLNDLDDILGLEG